MVLLVSAWLALSQASSSPALDERKVMAAVSSYLAAPERRQAMRLLAVLPPHRTVVSGATFAALWSLVPVLEARGVAGDASATSVAFRLLHFSDAAFGEELEVSLGQIATARPRVFLRCLAVARGESPAGDPLRVVAAFDPDLSAPERQAARDQRTKRLQSVSERPLRALRDECIRLLSAQAQGQYGAT